MRVIVAGRDGLCVRPTAMWLSTRGRAASDGESLGRRRIGVKLGSFYDLSHMHGPHDIDGDGRGPSLSRV